LLLAPQTGLEAKSRHHGVRDRDHDSEKHYYKARKHHKSKKHHHRAHKKHRHLRAIKAELALLKQAISEMNAKMVALEPQGAQIPVELVDKLNALQMAIDANQTAIDRNFNEIGVSLALIESNNMGISNLDTRITDLETAGPPGYGPPEKDLVYSGHFTQTSSPGFGSQFDWAVFKSNATGSFSSIEIRNSLGGSVVCDNSDVVQQIVGEFNSHVPVKGSIVSFTCAEPTMAVDVTWNIGFCGGEVELNAGLSTEPYSNLVCQTKFSTGAVVRPLIGNDDWGGIGPDFGGPEGTFNRTPPTQTLEVILKR
jgi:hypothetical protein